MEKVLRQAGKPEIKKNPGSFFEVIAGKQTYLNLAYLMAGSACGLIDLVMMATLCALILALIATLLWSATWFPVGLVSVLQLIGVVLGGVGMLAIPLIALLCFLPSVLEQRLAAWLLKVNFGVKPFWHIASGQAESIKKYLVSATAWKRVLFCALRIPLGTISLLAVVTLIPAYFAVLLMPVAYMAGFHELTVWLWLVDTFAKCLAMSFTALFLTPFMAHGLNLLARFSGWLAATLLKD